MTIRALVEQLYRPTAQVLEIQQLVLYALDTNKYSSDNTAIGIYAM